MTQLVGVSCSNGEGPPSTQRTELGEPAACSAAAYHGVGAVNGVDLPMRAGEPGTVGRCH